MKRITIILLIILSHCFSVFAQDIPTNNSISSKNLFFAYGQAYNLKIDKTYSRLSKNGFNNLFNLGYDNLNDNRILNIQGSLMKGTLNTEGNSMNFINNLGGNIKLKYLKKIKKIDIDMLSVFIGASGNFRGEIWFSKNNQLRFGWDANLGVGLATTLHYKINEKLSIRYDFDISALGVLWRSHNNGQQLITEEIQFENGIIASAFEESRFSHIFNTVYIDNSLKLIIAASNKIDVYYNFILMYEHIEQPLVKKGYEFNNALGIAYKF